MRLNKWTLCATPMHHVVLDTSISDDAKPTISMMAENVSGAYSAHSRVFDSAVLRASLLSGRTELLVSLC